MSYRAEPPPSDLVDVKKGETDEEVAEQTTDGAAETDESIPELEYELDNWTAAQRRGLELLLTAEDIAHVWNNGNVVVAEEEEERVDALVDRAEAGDEGNLLKAAAGAELEEGLDLPDPGGSGDDEETYTALAHLFSAVDHLANRPGDLAGAADVLDGIESVKGMEAPYGVEKVEWIHVRRVAATLADAIADEASDDIVKRDASALRDVLRPYL